MKRDVAPDFFLTSSEGYGLRSPRACYQVKRLRCGSRDDLMLVWIDPPIVGQPYGSGGDDISDLVLAARHIGDSLFSISDWPVAVHVYRPLKMPVPDVLMLEDIGSMVWAYVYPSASTDD